MNNDYFRKFITLSADNTTRGKAFGTLVVEKRDNINKVNVSISNVRPSIKYSMVFGKIDEKNPCFANIGTFTSDEFGSCAYKCTVSKETLQNVELSEFDVCIIKICNSNEVITPLVGYFNGKKKWREHYKPSDSVKKDVPEKSNTSVYEFGFNKKDDKPKDVKKAPELVAVVSDFVDDKAPMPSKHNMKDDLNARKNLYNEHDDHHNHNHDHHSSTTTADHSNHHPDHHSSTTTADHSNHHPDHHSSTTTADHSNHHHPDHHSSTTTADHSNHHHPDHHSSTTTADHSNHHHPDHHSSTTTADHSNHHHPDHHSSTTTADHSNHHPDHHSSTTTADHSNHHHSAAPSNQIYPRNFKLVSIKNQIDSINKNIYEHQDTIAQINDEIKSLTDEKDNAVYVKSAYKDMHTLPLNVDDIFEKGMEVLPFISRGKEVEWVSIDFTDLVLIDKNTKFTKNPYFINSYKKYTHFILGKCIEQGRTVYLIGVPDFFEHDTEEHIRKMGFIAFKESNLYSYVHSGYYITVL